MPPVDRIHQLAQQRLRETTGGTVARLLAAAGREGRTGLVRASYAAGAARVVSGGQRAAGQLAAAYIAAYAPPMRPPNLVEALAGVLVTPDSPNAVGGLLRLWSLLDEELDPPQAFADAEQYASGMAQGDLQDAQRAGLDEAVSAADREPRWRLEPSPGACEWCRFIASTGARYLTADSVPVPHGTPKGGPCGCSPAPEF